MVPDAAFGVPGNVYVVESVPAKVTVLLTASVLPSEIVKVDPVAGVVRVTLLIVVAVAAPNVGVVKEGDVARAMPPDPVTAWPRAV